MKLTTSRDALHAAISPLARVAPTKTTLPALTHILVSAGDRGLTLTATDLELAMARGCAATISETGAIALPAVTLRDYVDSLPSGAELTMELDAATRRVAVDCGRSHAHIAGIDAADFPPVELPAPTMLGSLSADLLRAAIGDVEYAAAMDISRPVLAGVCIQARGERYELAAANGYRMAVRRIDRPVGAPTDMAPLIVPGAALRQIARILPQDETPVALSLGEQILRCAVGETVVTTRLIGGQFPDYMRVVPSDAATRITVDRSEWLAAVKRARVFSGGQGDVEITRLAIDTGTHTLTVSTRSTERGDGASTVDLADATGDAMDVAFNGRYLVDALERLRSDLVELSCPSATLGGQLRPVGPEHDDVLMVVMPMNVAREGTRAA